MGPTPFSNSQSSSSNDSSNSQISHIRVGSAGNFDRSQGDRFNDETTPSTSLSNSSSQEGVGKAQLGDYDDVLLVEERQPTYMSAASSQHERSRMLHTEHTSTPKRMANGEIKSSAYSLSNSPIDIGQHGHSRNSSRTSRGSQIGEVSDPMGEERIQTCLQ